VSRARPILIAFDGAPAAEHAIREGGPLLAGRDAVVLVVWKQGLAFDLVALPASSIGLPPAQIDVATALEGDREMYRAAESQARRGAALAREAGSTPSPASSPTTRRRRSTRPSCAWPAKATLPRS
jgi:hypothetical protein